MISIHASREGSDPLSPTGAKSWSVFQSTLPAREATYGIQQGVNHAQISIHASREGSDQAAVDMAADWYHFNPRFPRGKRRVLRGVLTVLRHFNPRFPRGKRRQFKGADPKELAISIHASRGGSDQGRRGAYLPFLGISIHASRGGSDSLPCYNVDRFYNFNPRFPRGKRLPRT